MAGILKQSQSDALPRRMQEMEKASGVEEQEETDVERLPV